jgi:hypothetical protein
MDPRTITADQYGFICQAYSVPDIDPPMVMPRGNVIIGQMDKTMAPKSIRDLTDQPDKSKFSTICCSRGQVAFTESQK